MAAEDLRKRIEALNKAPLRSAPEPREQEPPEIRSLRRKLRRQASEAEAARSPVCLSPAVHAGSPAITAGSEQQPAPPRRDFGPSCALEEAAEGTVVESAEGFRHYLIQKPADALEADAAVLYTRFVSLTGWPDGACVSRLAQLCAADRIDPRGVLFLDLETTGLGMTPVFLVGTMECSEDGFVFRQYFARDYSEEASIISAVSNRLGDTELLVTFNGKSFDLPFLNNRAVATGVRVREAHAHLDLLHEARRVYRGDLPNCKLQTLEHAICGRERDDDIPGSEIPAAYHEFVRTGDARKIGVILTHNLYDLLTMADLMHRMWRAD